MTEETPIQRKRPSGIVCDECGHAVVVDRSDHGTLQVTCACDELRSIKVATKLPEGWGE